MDPVAAATLFVIVIVAIVSICEVFDKARRDKEADNSGETKRQD